MCVCVCVWVFALTVRYNWHQNNLLMNNCCLPGYDYDYSLKLIAEHNIYIYYMVQLLPARL